MPFVSKKERRLWIWALIATLTILSTLWINQPLANQLRDQNTQALFFVTGMVLVAAAVIVHGLKYTTGKIELSVLIGIAALYLMFVFRLGAPERSHLIEYSVLALLIHRALRERASQKHIAISPAILAVVISFLVGVADEFIQLALPNRVFDFEDILFNGLASLMAITASVILRWLHHRFSRSHLK